MFSKINKTKKNFIGAIAMSLILLMGSALGFLIETNLSQLVPTSSDSWANYATGLEYSAGAYRVKSAGALACLLAGKSSTNATIYLDTDIDLSGHTWEGISSSMVSRFYGQNHTISNLNGTQGLFKGLSSGATVQDLTLSNVNIAGGSYVGAVSGMGGTITNVTVSSGTIQGISYVGGISGGNSCTVKNSVNNATVIGKNGVGGIIGYTASQGAYNCVNTGDVFGETDVGGIGGHVDGSTDCYAECTVSGNSNVGGVVGGLDGGWGSLSNSGFHGKIIINSSTPSSIGSLVGAARSATYGFRNNFGIAEIQLVNSTDTSVVHQFGADTTMLASSSSNISSDYSYSKVFTSSGITEYRKFKVGVSETEPFSDFVYNEHINGGFPFYKSLFAVGNFIECDTMSYLEEYGFGMFNFPIKNLYGKYYVEVGEYPQAFVGYSLNNTLKSWYSSSSPTSVGSYTNDTGTSGTVTNYAYMYNGTKYVRVVSAAVNTSGYTFPDGVSVTSGNEYWFKVEPIRWWILNYDEVLAGQPAMVLADKGLTANVPWSKTSSSSNRWSNSNVRTWLNGTFYNDAFNSNDKSYIQTTTLSDDNTDDNVWLVLREPFNLSILNSTEKRTCYATDYALVNKCYIFGTSYLSDGEPVRDTRCGWWTREASYGSVITVEYSGGSELIVSTVTSYAVRPALTLNI